MTFILLPFVVDFRFFETFFQLIVNNAQFKQFIILEYEKE
jgi:hypothetical protein